MILPGRLTGADARRFPSHAYRVPIARPIESIMDVDPDRLHPAREYPRSVPSPAQAAPSIEAEDVLDFEVRAGACRADGSRAFEVWLVPSPYSRDRNPWRIAALTFAGGVPLRAAAEEAARRAFRR